MLDWLKTRISLPDTVSEKILVARAKQGDAKAFEKLYIHYLDRMYRYIYYKVNQDKMLAEDLTETVLLKAWKHIGSFQNDDGYLRAWLYRIAHNTVIDYYRTQKSTFSLDERFESSELHFDIQLEQRERREHIEKALQELTDDQKEAVTLHFIEDVPSKEIALIMQKNDDAVRALIHRGLEKLRGVLGDNYGNI